MDPDISSNGHRPHHEQDEPVRAGANVYADLVRGDQPPEILEFETSTDPYANMLPGISNINAARTLGRGVQVGRRGNRLIMTISIALLFVIVLPVVLTIISQLNP